jgi:hypothetical protein
MTCDQEQQHTNKEEIHPYISKDSHTASWDVEPVQTPVLKHLGPEQKSFSTLQSVENLPDVSSWN